MPKSIPVIFPVLMLSAVLVIECLWAREAVSKSASEALVYSEYEFDVQELFARRNGNNIYGVLYLPRAAGKKLPTVIFSHGFGGNYRVGTPYAEALAKQGYAVYCFDFCGGSQESRSEGSVPEMSIFTEQTDLEAVIAMLGEQPFVDKDNLFLMGTSQGGVVSAMTAAAHKDMIRGVVLFYPAFVLVDDVRRMFQHLEDIPDSFFLRWMTVGRIYAESVLDYDIYDAISSYKQSVLILHGDADPVVPLSYSERAVKAYRSARLEIFPGAGHGFSGEDTQRAIDLILTYLEGHRKNTCRQIRMTTENTEIFITLNHSRATDDLLAMLPLELTLIERNNFAKGMTLPDYLSAEESTTREYEIGDFGYWDAGPDLAIFYDDIYEQTVVPVIPLGHAEFGAEGIRNEAGKVKLELVK